MSNSIAVENQKPGAPPSEWMLEPGQANSSIEGFTTSMSTNLGNTVDFKINTDSDNYRIDIYRLGYYGGDGATLVTSIEHQAAAAIVQPSPLKDPSTGNIDAGNWSVTDSWSVPADATSGVYIAKLVRLDGTSGENIIPFVVTNNASTSDIIFQTSDQTWQAYNAWGGGSFYIDTAQNISYNRPIQTPAGPDATTSAGPWDFVFGEELPAIYWLEQNGYDVSYQSGIDTATNGSLLLNHKAFLSVGHDEYWTAQQQNNVRAARDAGVNLNFWSGNEVYWTTELLPSIAGSGEPNRTLVTYKTTATGLNNPDGTWTGLTRDPTGGLIPENALTGQMYLVDQDKTTPLHNITVPFEDAQLSIWKNTDVANLRPGETYTTAGAYLGYEWDVNGTSNPLANNGFSPPGLITLSSTTVTTSALSANYLATAGLVTGTPTHNLTLYRAASGALVFGAGTVMWSWGLSSLHTDGPDGSPTNSPTDPAIQQAMVNLLAAEGIQPETLEATLVMASQSTDHVAPISLITNNGSGIFTAGQSVTISGIASDAGGGVVAGEEISTDGGITWNQAMLAEKSATTNWSYTWTPTQSGAVTILARAVDDSANLENPQQSPNFSITDFLNNFSVAQGWYSTATPRMVADLNGDGKSDLIGFGDAAVWVSLGQGNGSQYNEGPSLSKTMSLTENFTIAQGFSAAYARGIEFVGNFANSPSDRFATIWAEGADGFYFDVATGSNTYLDPMGNSYLLPVYSNNPVAYGNFGLAQGWTQSYNFDVSFVENTDAYASVIGFGEAGLWIGPQAFRPGADSSELYIAQGSETLGNSSGWDSTLDVRAVRDYWGNTIDLNGDGIMDFVGMGQDGLVYAMGEFNANAPLGSNAYSLGTLHTAEIGVTGTTGSSFGRAQGWDNINTVRFIADVNNDGHVDIVGFGQAGVYVSLGQTPSSDGSGAFQQAYLAADTFGSDQGWSPDLHSLALGDVYGNGQIDIVGFGADETYIATPSTDPATGHITWAITDQQIAYGSNAGFLPGQNFRGLADLSGTGQSSIVVGGQTNTQIVSHV